MAERIIKELEGLPYPSYRCVAFALLGRIREKIRGLKDGCFSSVLEYVRNSGLPYSFKEELEEEYLSRNQ